MEKSKLVVIGEVVKPHGIRGEFCVESHADSPRLFAVGARLGLRGKNRPERFVTVRSCRPHQGRLLLTIEGVEDRDAADALRGLEVVVPPEALPELPDDEIYLHEIVGFACVLPDGTPVGELEGFMDSPGQDLWVIRAADGREILFPAHDESVVAIDEEQRRIVIDPPPGLLEL